MPLSTVFQVVVSGKHHKAATLLRVLSDNLGKQSLRGSCGVGLEIGVERGFKHTAGLVYLFLFPLTLHCPTPRKSQAVQICYAEGAVVHR